MSQTICAFDHQDWNDLGLADYGDFSDCIEWCNQGEDAFSGYGRWYYIPDEPLPDGSRVIYHGTYGNYNSPGASSYTYAEIYDPDEKDEYTKHVAYWERQEEWEETEDEDMDDEWGDDDTYEDSDEDSEEEDEYPHIRFNPTGWIVVHVWEQDPNVGEFLATKRFDTKEDAAEFLAANPKAHLDSACEAPADE